LLIGIDPILIRERPDWVIVQGDTTSAYCGALAAFQLGIPVAHVEAGLRTGDLQSPFPEEFNRRAISLLAKRHFCPTARAKRALVNEGVSEKNIFLTGNTVVDAINIVKKRWKNEQATCWFGKLGIPNPENAVLITCHRRENTERIVEICNAVKMLADDFRSSTFIFILHPNPIFNLSVRRELSGVENILLINPVDYEETLRFLSSSRLVISDSGGIQEEAPSFGVPVIVTRDHTERSEGVDLGFSFLVGLKSRDIVKKARYLLSNDEYPGCLLDRPNPYGDGHAAKRIAKSLLNSL
jgi:UDP-N-acetylglucosamine 2-epimerase (non-hydrolysing)